ncbi:4-(cytidine 5'-diphospho)-2-C-methyl-D-erythritol kinase [Peptoniphilus sp. ING2-D1G]|nr:4-(cytidine 5'-diphospho)-2-C-methyl-D-erythritol kinase [Peptoniphilus sp. ING2-D1G]
MRAKSYGKINLSLDVISKRRDGYHNIKTIMQKISLYDEMEFIKIKRGFKFLSNVDELDNEDNLVYKAHNLLETYTGKKLPIEIHLKKNLPMASGLAGGTGNGALTLRALNKIYRLGISLEELCKESLKLGADFPYMLVGGTILAEGIGEKLEVIDDFCGQDLLIVNPGYGISTKKVYENLDIDNDRIDFDAIREALKTKNFFKLSKFLQNKMESSVFKNHPDLSDIKKKLKEFGGIPLMSGSGATMFAIFDDRVNLNKAYDYYKDLYKYTYMAKTVGGEDEL